MKTTILGVLIAVMFGCSAPMKVISSGEGTPKGYAAASEFIGRDAAMESRSNIDEGKIRFYGIGFQFEGTANVPGLTQEEINKYISEMNYPLEIIANDTAPFAVISEQFSYADYWKAIEDFISDYNRLILAEISEGKA